MALIPLRRLSPRALSVNRDPKTCGLPEPRRGDPGVGYNTDTKYCFQEQIY